MIFIKTLYVFSHLVSFFLLKRRFELFFLMLVVPSLIITYALKSDTYDIISYTNSVSYAHVFEPGFSFIISGLFSFLGDKRHTIAVYQFFLVMLYFYAAVKVKRKFFRFKENSSLYYCFMAVLLVALSVSFSLGVNNGLRQSTASVLIVLALLSMRDYNDRRLVRWVKAFAFISASLLFHKSSILFAAYSIMFLFFADELLLSNKRSSLKISVFAVFVLFISFASFLLMDFLISLGYYSSYGDKNLSGSERVSFPLKLLILFLLFLFSEFLAGKYIKARNIVSDFRLLRAVFLVLVLPVVFFPSLSEAGSRVLYFYFTIEAYFVLVLFFSGRRIASVFILFSYAFAFNALNVIGGG